MKTFSSGFLPTKPLAALAALALLSLPLSGCAQGQTGPGPAPAATPTQTSETEAGAPSPLIEVEGRAVSATDSELIFRTIDSELTFQIREEDVRAIDPKHIQSHLGVKSIGFRAFYRNIDGVDYVVSIEEIDGSTLGFE